MFSCAFLLAVNNVGEWLKSFATADDFTWPMVLPEAGFFFATGQYFITIGGNQNGVFPLG